MHDLQNKTSFELESKVLNLVCLLDSIIAKVLRHQELIEPYCPNVKREVLRYENLVVIISV